MYKLGLTYKRMDIHYNELREEFRKDNKESLGRIRQDIDLVNEVVQQVHDELESREGEAQRLHKKTEREMKLLVQSNDVVLAQHN